MDKQHRIYLNDGKFKKGYTYADVADLFTRFRDSGKPTLAVHFHGGLNAEKAGEETAARLTPLYSDHAFPVFFIWQSGLLDALRYLLRDLFDDLFLRKLFALAVERILRDHPDFSTMSRAEREQYASDEIARWRAEPRPSAEGDSEPFSGIDLAPLQRATFGTADQDAFARELGDRRDVTPTTMSDPARVSLRWPWPVQLALVVYHVLKRFRKHRDHGIYCTVYEELLHGFAPGMAAEFWKQMKDACSNAFGRSTDSMGQPRCGGTAFFRELQSHWNASSQQRKPRLVLVGHSCGALFICDWLKAADGRLSDDIKFDVILLAAACNFDKFHDSVVESHHRIANIRAFAMTDAAERRDPSMRGAAYSRSLLYLVAGALEGGWGQVRRDEPLVGMERYHVGRGPYDDEDILESLAFLEDGSVFGPTPQDASRGWATDARQHGQFDDYDPEGVKETMRSVAAILQYGFEPRARRGEG